MRRHILHIAVASLAFTAGLLATGNYEHLSISLPVAFCIFTILKKIIGLNPTFHHLKVALVTLVLWVVDAYIIINVFFPPTASCVMGIPYEATESSNKIGGESQIATTTELNNYDLPNTLNCSCDGTNTNAASFNSVWGGMLDKRAVRKPAPYYPPFAKAAQLKSTVAVSVVIDENGKVIWARSISGHPLLRQAAKDAACHARFYPIFIDGLPVMVSGVLTYNFGLS